MPARESNIPLFLWIATAVLAHLAWGGGATRVSRVIEERLDVKRFAQSVRSHVVQSAGPIEIALLSEELDDDPTKKETDEEESEEEEEKEEETEDELAKQSEDSKKDDPKAKADDDVKDDKDEKVQKLDIVEEEKKAEEEKKKEEEALPDLPVLPTRNRIAVRQHVEDKSQKDNPDAEYIADEANKVAEQTQARITSTDQNDPDPNPGGAHTGPTPDPGNSDESRVAQSEDRPGVADMAPNETGKDDKDKGGAEQQPTPPQAAQASNAPESDLARARAGADRGSEKSKTASRAAAQKGQKAAPGTKSQEAAPDTINSEDGTFAVAKEQEAKKGRKARRAKKKRLPPPKRSTGVSDYLGFGSRGTTKSGVNLNLNPQTAVAAIGADKLARERRADAARRKSAHVGSWKSLGIDKWRSAIENYVPSVKPGNQTALNTARVPFASYLNTIHNRLHPIFADSFLASLDSLPGSHPMNRLEITTHLEIVLSQEDGRVVRMGVTRTSGVTAFDIAALESVQRGSPYGAPPRDIVSPDGNVYFHWEFHRKPYFACSTYFARPYILKVKPKSAPPTITPPTPRPYDPAERPGKDERHGHRHVAPPLEKHAALR